MIVTPNEITKVFIILVGVGGLLFICWDMFLTAGIKYTIGKQLTRAEFIHLMTTAEVCRSKRHRVLVPKFNIKRIMLQRHMLGDNNNRVTYYVIHRQFMRRTKYIQVVMNESVDMYLLGSVGTWPLGGHDPNSIDAHLGEDYLPPISIQDYYQ